MLTFVAKSAGRDICLDPSFYFDHQGDNEWVTDPFCKEMVLDIDKSEVIAPYLIQSPVFGPIPPRMLSGGVKGLILLYKAESLPFTIAATSFGENCCKWLVKIAEKRDITLYLDYFMDFDKLPIDFYMKDVDKHVKTWEEYFDEAFIMLNDDKPELHFDF